MIDWGEYCRVHSRRSNLLIHIFAVPAFAVAAVLLAVHLALGNVLWAAAAAITAAVAMALQGVGHRREAEPPRPFTGPGNFLRRWFSEQFVIFPLFVLTGRWRRQLRKAFDV